MSPIRALKVRPHVGHCWRVAAVWVESAAVFRAARLLLASTMRQVSAARAPVVILLCQLGRSRVCDSQLMSMLRSFIEAFRLSIRYFFCPTMVCFLWYNSPYRSYFGSLLSGILIMGPAPLSCTFWSRVKTPDMTGLSRTTVTGILSCHLMQRILRRQLRLQWLSSRSFHI